MASASKAFWLKPGHLAHPLGHLVDGEAGRDGEAEDVGPSGQDAADPVEARVLVEGVGPGLDARQVVELAPDPVGQRAPDHATGGQCADDRVHAGVRRDRHDHLAPERPRGVGLGPHPQEHRRR